MNNNLMARLRHWQQYGPYRPSRYKKAADYIENLEHAVLHCFERIEELQAALRNIIVHCEVPAPPNAEALKMFARKALEKKDD